MRNKVNRKEKRKSNYKLLLLKKNAYLLLLLQVLLENGRAILVSRIENGFFIISLNLLLRLLIWNLTTLRS